MPTPPPSLDLCLVTGSLRTVGNEIPRDAKIIFRPVQFPSISGDAIITADAVKTVPDVNGNFQVNLVQGSVVVVEVERTGIKAQVTIPHEATATLTSLLPPPTVGF